MRGGGDAHRVFFMQIPSVVAWLCLYSLHVNKTDGQGGPWNYFADVHDIGESDRAPNNQDTHP
jgi:hypothetical protein